jgi:hypothetical protein
MMQYPVWGVGSGLSRMTRVERSAGAAADTANTGTVKTAAATNVRKRIIFVSSSHCSRALCPQLAAKSGSNSLW